MADRTILIRGPFTEDQAKAIVYAVTTLVQHIEGDHPDETFQILLDDPNTDSAIEELLDKIPVRPGYERITHFIPKAEDR
jgi:hypothetical protein